MTGRGRRKVRGIGWGVYICLSWCVLCVNLTCPNPHPVTHPNPLPPKGPDYYGDDIFDWSVGAASLPAPPRRTLQRMGVPEQLRQFFLLKVVLSPCVCWVVLGNHGQGWGRDRCRLTDSMTDPPNQSQQDLDKLRALPPDDARYKEIPPRYHQVRWLGGRCRYICLYMLDRTCRVVCVERPTDASHLVHQPHTGVPPGRREQAAGHGGRHGLPQRHLQGTTKRSRHITHSCRSCLPAYLSVWLC